MGLILIAFGIILLGFLFMWIYKKWEEPKCNFDDSWWVAAMTSWVFGGLFLFILLIVIPIQRFDVKANIQEYEAFKKTVQISRLNELSEYERAAITKDVADWNQWIARAKYYNNTFWFGVYWPNEVDKLEPFE